MTTTGWQFGVAVALCGLALLTAGCHEAIVPPEGQDIDSARVADDDQLRRELDEVLEFTLHNRSLNTEDHAAWQILHGALAYGKEFPVRVGRDGPVVSAVEHILGGGRMNGWDVAAGDVLDPVTGRRGLRAILEPGSKAGQGHVDQWLGYLAECGLGPEQTIQVADKTYTMADLLAQAQRDVPRNEGREWTWTLMGLTAYLPTTATWLAGDGRQWSIGQLVQLEAEQELTTSACGGTHRLVGLAMALNHHLDQGGQLDGPWKLADEVIRQSVQTARRLQNSDGSFSTNYFSRGGQSADLADVMRTTGHTLEFLTLSVTDEELREPWMGRAALRLCDAFRKTKDMPLECGALYHAAHGLVLYRQRLFGPRQYAPSSKADGVDASSS
jgi:hypothetical protein